MREVRADRSQLEAAVVGGEQECARGCAYARPARVSIGPVSGVASSRSGGGALDASEYSLLVLIAALGDAVVYI